MMNYETYRQEYDQAAARLLGSGLQGGTGGNLSLRLPEAAGMLIKSSGKTLAEPVWSDFSGNVLEGGGRPSAEYVMHSEIYRLRPDCNGVVHAHGNWSVAWSLTGLDLPLVTFTAKQKIGEPVPVISIKKPNVELEDFSLIAAHLADLRTKAFILRGHGLVCLGTSLIDAVHLAELVEESAQAAWNSVVLHRLHLLPEDFEDFHELKLPK